MFYHVLLGCFFVVCLDPSLAKDVTCMQYTRRLTHVKHTKHYSRASYYRAAHKLLLVCSARKIAHAKYTKVDSCAAHFVSHTCFDSSHAKYWRMHACSLHASVNLRHELYCITRVLTTVHLYLLAVTGLQQPIDLLTNNNYMRSL